MSSLVPPGWMIGWSGQSCESSWLPQRRKLCLQLLTVSPLVCAEEREQEEAARRERARLWEMDEDEYDALTEEEKTQFNIIIRQAQREKRCVSLPRVTPQKVSLLQRPWWSSEGLQGKGQKHLSQAAQGWPVPPS